MQWVVPRALSKPNLEKWILLCWIIRNKRREGLKKIWKYFITFATRCWNPSPPRGRPPSPIKDTFNRPFLTHFFFCNWILHIYETDFTLGSSHKHYFQVLLLVQNWHSEAALTPIMAKVMKKFHIYFGSLSLSSCHIIDRCSNTIWFVVRLLRMIAILMSFYVLSEEYLQQSFGDVQCGGGRRGNWPSSVKTAKLAKNLSQNCILSLTLYWTSVKELLYLLLFYHM